MFQLKEEAKKQEIVRVSRDTYSHSIYEESIALRVSIQCKQSTKIMDINFKVIMPQFTNE